MKSIDSPTDAENSEIHFIYGQIAEEFETARSSDREPEFSMILKNHPNLSDQIEQMIPTIGILYEIADKDGQPNSTVQDASDQDERPKELGDFRIIKEIGRGGMGVVYEAEQISLNRRVALKVLPMAAFLDERQLQRFKNEARAAALLKHTNIVNIHAVGCERSIHFYAMELIDGFDLAAVIRERAGQSPNASDSKDTSPLAKLSTQQNGSRQSDFYPWIAKIGSQAAEALHFAHQQGVIHRDIKPANLLLDQSANIHITDFGLAHTHAAEGLTMSGDLLGTLRYLSPERIDGSRPADHLADIYSLGLTLYELVACRPAFQDSSRQQLVHSILETEPTSLRKIDPSLPSDLQTVIEKAISKEPDDRYRDAKAFADDLQRFLQNRTILARPVSAITRASRFAKRNPMVTTLLTISTILFGMLALGSSATAWNYSRVASERKAEARTLTMEVYARDIRLAQFAIGQGRRVEAERLLLKWVPEGDQEDQRGIEWYHLWGRKNDPTLIRSISNVVGAHDVAFTPEGLLLDSYMRLWDLQQPISASHIKLTPWFGWVYELHMRSPYLFAGSGTGAVRIWNWKEFQNQSIDTPKPAIIRLGMNNAITSICSIDTDSTGKFVAIGAFGYENEGLVEVHRINSLDRISLQFRKTWHDGSPNVHFDEMGRLIVTYSKSQVVRVIDLDTNVVVNESTCIDGFCTASCVFPDRTKIAIAIEKKSDAEHRECWIEVRHLDDWSKHTAFILASAAAKSIHVSRDGTQMIAGDDSGNLWNADLKSGEVKRKRLHDGKVRSVKLSADNTKILTAGSDGFIHVLHSDFSRDRNSSVVRCEGIHREGVNGAAFLDDRRVSTSRDDRFVDIWDAQSGKLIKTLELEPGFGDWVRLQADLTHHRLVAFQMQFAYEARSNLPGRVTVWDTRTLEETFRFDIPNGLITVKIGFSPDGRYLAVPGSRWLNHIDLQTGKIRIKEFPCRLALCCSYSSDGKTLACSEVNGKIYMLDAATLEPIQEFIGDNIKQDCVTFIPNTNLLAVSGGENRLQILDATTGESIRTSERYPELLATIATSRDGRRLAVGGLNGNFRVFRTEDCQELIRFDIPQHFCFGDFSPNGQSLVMVAGRDAFVIHGTEMEKLKNLSIAELQESYCGQIQFAGKAESKTK